MAKVHLQIGLFGKAACGKDHVDVTKLLPLITCGACQQTAVYQALKAGTIKVTDLNIR